MINEFIIQDLVRDYVHLINEERHLPLVLFLELSRQCKVYWSF